LSGHLVVDTIATAANLTVHLLKDFGLEEPVAQFESSHAKRILQVLVRSGTEAVNGNRKRRYFDFAHGVFVPVFQTEWGEWLPARSVYHFASLLGAKIWDLDECPLPTLTDAPRSAHGGTRLQYAVRLCAILGIRCSGRNRTD
jgi:hypothetical protein